ncbi:Gfo/Idh/MocA family oxidoreductase [bacterium]|nr:Gfo/Idh/MocA family oxidoreductase [bacterium]
MGKIKVGIIGCGHILNRHLESIEYNSKKFELVALCDIDKGVLDKALEENKVVGFVDYKNMLKEMDGKMDMVTIATPNHLHHEMAIDSLNAGYDILIEKPIAFEASKVEEISDLAKKLDKKAYAVLQVRYNPAVQMMREVIKQKLLGDIRSVSFIQRWQRPIGYFKDWRGVIDQGGKSLYEYAIHYLDILQGMFGVPKVKGTYTSNHKHLDIPFEDTLYSVVEYKNGASGAIEVNVAVEPSNLECSIAVMGSQGFLKISGNALDVVERASFETEELQKKWEKIQSDAGDGITPNSYGTHVGSCPNHPKLYKEIAKGKGIKVSEAIPSIQFIQNVYGQEEN